MRNQRMTARLIALIFLVSCSNSTQQFNDVSDSAAGSRYKIEDPNHLIPATLHPYSTFSPSFEWATRIRQVLLTDLLKHPRESEWKLLALWILDPALNQPRILALQHAEARKSYRLLFRRSATAHLKWDERNIREVHFIDSDVVLDPATAQVIHHLWVLATSHARKPASTPKGAVSTDGWSSYFFSFDENNFREIAAGMTITPTEKDKISFRMEGFASELEKLVENGATEPTLSSIRMQAIKLIKDIEAG